MIKLLHRAVDHGVTLFDTGEIYGLFINEELVGEVIYAYRNKVSPDVIRQVCEDELFTVV